jgi:hypothetical protein
VSADPPGLLAQVQLDQPELDQQALLVRRVARPDPQAHLVDQLARLGPDLPDQPVALELKVRLDQRGPVQPDQQARLVVLVSSIARYRPLHPAQ